jgi:hypothetical protein
LFPFSIGDDENNGGKFYTVKMRNGRVSPFWPIWQRSTRNDQNAHTHLITHTTFFCINCELGRRKNKRRRRRRRVSTDITHGGVLSSPTESEWKEKKKKEKRKKERKNKEKGEAEINGHFSDDGVAASRVNAL